MPDIANDTLSSGIRCSRFKKIPAPLQLKQKKEIASGFAMKNAAGNLRNGERV
jgi:hypothetical protein